MLLSSHFCVLAVAPSQTLSGSHWKVYAGASRTRAESSRAVFVQRSSLVLDAHKECTLLRRDQGLLPDGIGRIVAEIRHAQRRRTINRSTRPLHSGCYPTNRGIPAPRSIPGTRGCVGSAPGKDLFSRCSGRVLRDCERQARFKLAFYDDTRGNTLARSSGSAPAFDVDQSRGLASESNFQCDNTGGRHVSVGRLDGQPHKSPS